MGTCSTCRWWGHGKENIVWKDETVARACGCPKLIDINELGYVAVTGSGFGLDYPVCDLITGPNFGCVHWEKAA